MDTEVVAAPAHVCRDVSRGIYNGLQAHMNNPRLSDIILVRPDGRSIHAHQIILAACSRKFAAVLGNGDATGKELPIQGVDSAALESVIGFFYRGECLITSVTVVPIYDVCVKLEVPGLSAGCEEYIQQNLSPETCPIFLEASVQVLLEPVIKLCLEYAKSRFDDVVASSAFQSLGGEAIRLLLMYCRTSVGEMGLARALARWAVRRPEHLADCETMFKELNITTTVLLQLLQSPDFVAGLQAVVPSQPAAADREAGPAAVPRTGSAAAAPAAGAAGPSRAAVAVAAAAPAVVTAPAGGSAAAAPEARSSACAGVTSMASGDGAAAAVPRSEALAFPAPRLSVAEGPTHLLGALGQPLAGGSGRQLQQLLLPAGLGSGAASTAAAGQRSPSSSSAGGAGRSEALGTGSGPDRDRDSDAARPRPTSSISKGERWTGRMEALGGGKRPSADGGSAAGAGSGGRAAQQQQQQQQSRGRLMEHRGLAVEGGGTRPGVYLNAEAGYPPPLLLGGGRGVVRLGGCDPRDDSDAPRLRRLDASGPAAAAFMSSPMRDMDLEAPDAEASRLRRSPKRGAGLEHALGTGSGFLVAAAEDVDAVASPSSGDGGGGASEALFAVPLSALEQAGLALLLTPSGALAVRGGPSGSTTLPLQVVSAGVETNAPLLALLPRSLVKQLQQGNRAQELQPLLPPQQQQPGRQPVTHSQSDRDLSYLAAPLLAGPLPLQSQGQLQRATSMQQSRGSGRGVGGGVGPGGAAGTGGGGSGGKRLPLMLEAAAEDSSVSGGEDPAFKRELKGEVLDLRLLGLSAGGTGADARAGSSAGTVLLPNRFPSAGRTALPMTGLPAVSAGGGGGVSGGTFLTAVASTMPAAALAAANQQQRGGAVRASGLGILSAAAAATAGAASAALSHGSGRGPTATGSGGAGSGALHAADGSTGLTVLAPQYGAAELASLAPPRWQSPAGGGIGSGTGSAAMAAMAAAAAAQLAVARNTGRPPGVSRDEDLPAVGASGGGGGGGKRRRQPSEEDDPDHVEEGDAGGGASGGGGGGRGGGGGSRGGRTAAGGREGVSGAVPGNKPPLMCHVDDCHVDLSNLKEYHQRFRICDFHLKAETVMRDGIPQRFCQQCGRFHLLSEFDGTKRSCRARLQRHNARRRKRPEQRGSGGDGGSDEQRKARRSPPHAPTGQQRESAPPPLLQPPPQLAALRDAAVAAGLAVSALGSAMEGPSTAPSDPHLLVPVRQQMTAYELATLQGSGEAAPTQGQPYKERSAQASLGAVEQERVTAAAASPEAATASAGTAIGGGDGGGGAAAAAPVGMPMPSQQLGGAGVEVRPQQPLAQQLRQQQQLATAAALLGVRIKDEADMQPQHRSHSGLVPDPAAESSPRSGRGQAGTGGAAGDSGPGNGSYGFAQGVDERMEGQLVMVPDSSAGARARYSGAGGAAAVRQPVSAAAAPAASGSNGSCDSSIDNDTRTQSRDNK